jgi:hypothetical protein
MPPDLLFILVGRQEEEEPLDKIIYVAIAFTLLCGILVFIIIKLVPWNLEQLAITATILSFIAFILTGIISSRLSPGRKLVVDEQEESPAIIVGITGLYGIVNGIGVTDALYDYGKALTINHISSAPWGLLGILSVDLPYTFRLVAFLVTIIPFVHGAILTTSRKWYKSHHLLAFVFFILVFIHAILFYLVALNISNISLFILLLWTIMALNSVWIVIQRLISGRRDIFVNEWFLLNFNTFAFLSVFVFVPANFDDVANNFNLNLLILLVMFSRSITDYIVGWKGLYNRNSAEPKPSQNKVK